MTSPEGYFRRLRIMLEKSGGFYTVEDILDHIHEGKMQSFATDRTWVVTQIHEFPRKKVLDIVFVVGEMEDLEELEPQLENFRREIQADMITATGRLGWLKKYFKGWKPTSVNFVRE